MDIVNVHTRCNNNEPMKENTRCEPLAFLQTMYESVIANHVLISVHICSRFGKGHV